MSSSTSGRYGNRASSSSARPESRKFRLHKHYNPTHIRCGAFSEALNASYRYNTRFFFSLIPPGFIAIATLRLPNFNLKLARGSTPTRYKIANYNELLKVTSTTTPNTRHASTISGVNRYLAKTTRTFRSHFAAHA